ncbi:MAG: hypothetical protein A4E52_01819 [Pelotomaculum sp. PtaB.Bin013]|nr:MAG: hypothetical protein A4E52_01819 [Pelotomaculum sp. PtaB.Bin013]
MFFVWGCKCRIDSTATVDTHIMYYGEGCKTSIDSKLVLDTSPLLDGVAVTRLITQNLLTPILCMWQGLHGES